MASLRTRVTVVTALAVLSLSFGAWYYIIKPTVIVSLTTKSHLFRLSEAVVGFNTQSNRLPATVNELVGARLLPEVGSVYFCPLIHDSLRSRALHFTNTEFEFRFTQSNVVICVPELVCIAKRKDVRYTWLKSASCLVVIDAATKHVNSGPQTN